MENKANIIDDEEGVDDDDHGGSDDHDDGIGKEPGQQIFRPFGKEFPGWNQ